VILGAENPLGLALAEKLAAESKKLRAVLFHRPTEDYTIPPEQRAIIDPLKEYSVADVCKGAGIIYDCYEPKYSAKKEVWPQVTSNAMMAAIEVSATLVFASHLLNSESENAHMEGEILNANKSNLTRTVVARIPQLYGTRVVNPLWKAIYDSVVSGKKAHWVGDPKVSRSFLDVEDAARAMVLLAQNPKTYARAWNIAGPEAISGTQFIELAYGAVGLKPNVGNWGRGIVLTGGLLSSDAREMAQMPYDYYSSFILDGKEFAETFPSFQFSTPAESVSKGIEWYRGQVVARK